MSEEKNCSAPAPAGPTNVKKGGSRRKKMKNHITFKTRDLETAEDGQAYAIVERALGNGRMSVVEVKSRKTSIAHIRGALTKKRVRIEVGDTVLVGIRDFEKDKCDIILKYTPDEIKQLRRAGELPADGMRDHSADMDDDEDQPFDFGAI